MESEKDPRSFEAIMEKAGYEVIGNILVDRGVGCQFTLKKDGMEARFDLLAKDFSAVTMDELIADIDRKFADLRAAQKKNHGRTLHC